MDLAKLVLGIAAGSIVLLIGYLLIMEFLVASNVRYAYEQVLNASRIGSELYTLDRFKRLERDLADLRSDPSKAMSPDDLPNANVVVQMLGQLPSFTSSEKKQLDDCISPSLPKDPSRGGTLTACLGILASVEQEALEAAASSTNAEVAGESVTKINDQRQSLHTFWIQMAQLILVNLLLPILTALLGYIFGKAQA